MSTQAIGTGATIPQASGGDWFNNILNTVAGGYMLHENRKYEEAQAQQAALLRQAEYSNQAHNSTLSDRAPQYADKTWIDGVQNSTVLLVGAAIVLSATLMK